MRELRIGLVLYGGVSLAVYMNGIVTELWQALRASEALHSGKAASLGGTARIYADLFKAFNDSNDAESIRVVVDALAGTSAGGVNAAVLGKAIVEGGDATVLNKIWLDQADITSLKADPPKRGPWLLRALSIELTPIGPLRRLRGLVLRLGLEWPWVRDHLWSLYENRDNGRATPLNGSYFAEKIAEGLSALGKGTPLLPSAARLDLFVTRTDFFGWPRHLPVSEIYHPTSLYERTHAHVMSFQARGGDKLDDYALTYAARTTAGFPVAFAPVATNDIKASFQKGQPGAVSPDLARFAATHLAEHMRREFDPAHAWMIDGGVLDNKPFTQLSQAIERKPADREVKRVVVFIEPDPEIKIEKPPTAPPAPLHVVKGMYGLLRHEPIYDDLDRLRDRNALVERIRRAIAADQESAKLAVKLAIGRSINTIGVASSTGDLKNWRDQTNAFAARQPLSGYPGYVTLKAERAAGVFADLLCRALDYPYESSQAFFVRRLTREWLRSEGALNPPALIERMYVLGPPQLKLLEAFDVPYRLRRVRHLVRIANNNYGADTRWALDAFKSDLAKIVTEQENMLDALAPVKAQISEAFGGVALGQIDDAIEGLKHDPRAALERYGAQLSALYTELLARFAEHGEKFNSRVEQALAYEMKRLSGRPRPQRALLRAFLTFPFVDLIAFPLMDAAGLEDLITVDVVRISPSDATSLSSDPHRLKSRELGAFMGFLSRPAREHDLLWGRLDGAERLIDLFVKAASRTAQVPASLDSLAGGFRRDIMLAILAEERARPKSTLGSVIDDLETQLRHP